MIQISIPGKPALEIVHLVLDYNGTLAFDGNMLPGVKEILNELSSKLQVHVITADTFGKAAQELKGVNCSLKILESGDHALQKANFVETLGMQQTIAIGNGKNDAAMLNTAAVGIVVMQAEGCSVAAMQNADILTVNILDALELLLNTNRIVATLRC